MYIQRFTKNTFYVEKNPTIVNFPIKSIEFGDFLTDEAKKKYPNGAPYDLIANVVHEGAPTSGTYKLHILHKGKFYLGHISNTLPYSLFLPELYRLLTLIKFVCF